MLVLHKFKVLQNPLCILWLRQIIIQGIRDKDWWLFYSKNWNLMVMRHGLWVGKAIQDIQKLPIYRYNMDLHETDGKYWGENKNFNFKIMCKISIKVTKLSDYQQFHVQSSL